MEDERKTKKQLIKELHELRQRADQLNSYEEEIKQTRITQEKFTKAFLQNSIPVTITTVKEGRFVDVSNAFLRLVELKRDEVVGHTSRETGFITEEQRSIFYNELSKNGHVEDLEMEVRPKGKGVRYGLFNVVMISYNNENYLLTAIQDITDRKQAEKALQKSEERYRNILESIQEGYFELDLNGNYTFINEANCRFLGYANEEMIGMNYRQHIDEENAKKLYRPYRALYHTGKPIESLEIESVRKDGTKVTHETSVSLIRDAEGKPIGFRGVSRNITDRKRDEEALHASEIKYRTLHQSMMDAFVSIDMDGRIKDYNVSYLSMLGYAPEEISKLTYKDITPEKWHMIEATIIEKQVLSKGYSDIYEKEYIRKDGTVFPVELRTNIIRNNEGTFTGMWAIVRDISERKQLEELIAKSEEKFRLITENMLDCVALVDTDGTYQYVTPSYRETLGYDPEDMIGITGFNITHPDDLGRITRLYQEGIEQGLRETNFETMIRHKDGHYVPMEIRVRAVNDRQGKIMGGVLAARDITKRREMEEELLRAHKLDSLGILAGGIAHDFNNLMAMVQGYIDLARMKLPSGHASYQYLLTAMQSAEQTKDLTSRLITFSQGGGPHRNIFDVAAIIRDAVQKTVKGTKVSVKFDFMENLCRVEVDELQMKQVFLNLTTNAVEAMPDGGNLTIQVENTVTTAEEVHGLKEGSYLKITFSDDGIGILRENLPKTFDPYFTTKGMGIQKGLGLGLAVCYSVMKKHGGHITVKSQSEKGTSFVLYLPAQMDLDKGKEVKKTLSTGTARVLIMDDEPNIREIERAYLERLGYEVVEAKDGQEAIDTYNKALDSSNPFDLVVMDLTVHQGLGGQLAMEQLLKIDPMIRAIIASGHLNNHVIENYIDYGFQGVLKKPFKAEEMKHLVEKILHA